MLPYATEANVIKIVNEKLRESGGGSTPSKDEIIAIVNKAIEDGEIVIEESDKKDSWRVAIRVYIDEEHHHYVEAYTDFYDTKEIVFGAISEFLETPITNTEEFNATLQFAGPTFGLRLMTFLGTINSYNTVQRYLSIYNVDMAEPKVYNVLCSGYFSDGVVIDVTDGIVSIKGILAIEGTAIEGYVQKNGEEY